MRTDRAPSARGRDWPLVAGALITGAAGAMTLIVSQRYLDLESFAPLAQLWTIWAVLAAGFTFSFQQWAAVQGIRRRDALVGGAEPRVAIGLIGVSIVLFAVSFTARDTLFHSSSWVWPAAAALLPLGTALNGIWRGGLARDHRRVALAGTIAGENVVRLLTSSVLIAIGAGSDWFALAVLAGFVVVVGPTSTAVGPPDPKHAEPRASGLATLGAATAAGFLAHALMFGSPLLLAAAGGSASEVSALFLVLAGVRIPFVVLQAVVPQLAVGLAQASDQAAAVLRARRVLTAVASLGAIGGAASGYVLGDLVIGSIFGIRGDVTAGTYALLAAASILAACGLVATVVLVVEARSRRIAVAWGIPALSIPVVAATGVVSNPVWLATWLLATQATVVMIALTPPIPRPAHPST